MMGAGVSREGLATLWETARAALPARSLAVLRPDGPDHVVMTSIDVFGVLANRYRAEGIVDAFRPRPVGRRCVTVAEMEARPDGGVEGRLLLRGQPEGVRRDHAARQALTLPVPDMDPAGVLVVGLAQEDPPDEAQLTAIDARASRAARLLPYRESPEAELERLRRIEAVDRLLPALFRVLDIREVFDRVSALTRAVLPHDILGLYNEDLTRLTVYADTSGKEKPDIALTRYPLTRAQLQWFRVMRGTGRIVARSLPNRSASASRGRQG